MIDTNIESLVIKAEIKQRLRKELENSQELFQPSGISSQYQIPEKH